MKIYRCEIECLTPMLQHKFPEDELMGLLVANKASKKKVIEDRTPRQIAERHVYTTKDGKFCFPGKYVVGAFKFAAGDYKMKNSSRKSLKTAAAGAFQPADVFITLCEKNWKPITKFEVDIVPAI